MLLFRGALASLGPAVITQSWIDDEEAIGPLARMQAWRDFGAACGPLVTGFLLTFVSAEIQHAAMALALAGGILFWALSSDGANALATFWALASARIQVQGARHVS